MAACEFEPRLQVKLAILVEELVSNVLRHGGESQDLALTLTLEEDDGSVMLKIEDDGPAFDPLAAAPITAPDPKTGGGIGLAIVQAWGENAAYCRSASGNRFVLTLR